MAGLTTILRNIHTLHQRLHDMHQESENQNRQVRRCLANLDKQQKVLAEVQEALKKIKLSVAEKELNIRDNQQKILKHQDQLNRAVSNKEYQALRTEIENEKLANRTLEDQILQAMELAEEKTRQIAELEKSIEQLREDLKKAEAVRDQWLAGQQERLSGTRNELELLEQQLPADLLGQYRRLIGPSGENGAEALSPILGRGCAGCHMEMTAQLYNEALVGKPVFCRSCGRLLYLGEDS